MGTGALGASGYCNDGYTYTNNPADSGLCGGSNNWGTVEMEVWYPLE